MVRRLRVAILDDHPIVLCGIRKALESANIEVLGAETTPSGLLTVLSQSPSDIIITDYSMPGNELLDGWRFIATVSSEFPGIPILVYSEFEDPFLVGSLVQRGVAGIVSKRDEMSEVLNAVRALANGGRYISRIAHGAMERFSEQPELRRFTALTPRQMEIAGLMLCGMSVCETARLLRRRVNTISSQRSAACKRLGFTRESEMYRFAIGHGLWLDRSSREADEHLAAIQGSESDNGSSNACSSEAEGRRRV